MYPKGIRLKPFVFLEKTVLISIMMKRFNASSYSLRTRRKKRAVSPKNERAREKVSRGITHKLTHCSRLNSRREPHPQKVSPQNNTRKNAYEKENHTCTKQQRRTREIKQNIDPIFNPEKKGRHNTPKKNPQQPQAYARNHTRTPEKNTSLNEYSLKPSWAIVKPQKPEP